MAADVEYVGPGLTWGRILSTRVISMWSNDTKCKYMFMFPLKKLTRKELTHPHNVQRTQPAHEDLMAWTHISYYWSYLRGMWSLELLFPYNARLPSSLHFLKHSAMNSCNIIMVTYRHPPNPVKYCNATPELLKISGRPRDLVFKYENRFDIWKTILLRWY